MNDGRGEEMTRERMREYRRNEGRGRTKEVEHKGGGRECGRGEERRRERIREWRIKEEGYNKIV